MTTRIAVPLTTALVLTALAALAAACGGKVVFEPEDTPVVDALTACESFCDAYLGAGCATEDCSLECDSILAASGDVCEPELAAVLACITEALVSGAGCEEVPTGCIGPAASYAGCLAQSGSSQVSVGVGGG